MMVRCLLIHPLGYNAKNAASDISRLANIMPPLGLASISAFLTSRGVENDIIDCYAHPNSDQLIIDYLRGNSPSFVGFSCTTSSFFDGLRLAHIAKKELPSVKVVFGGVHVSALKELAIEEYPIIDYCVIGEGEESFFELVTSKGSEEEGIQGIVLKVKKEKVVFNGYREHLLDLDSLPFPAYDKLTGYPDIYKLPIFNYPRVPNGSCISSRGCPYACTYCDRSVFKRTFRHNSAEYLYNHVLHLNRTFGIRHINFYDDQFTFHRQRVVAFCRKLIEQQLTITFNCAARAEHLDSELLKMMKLAGCWMISLGIETGDEDLLAQHRQNPDLQMMREKIELIKNAGIRVKGLLMMGLPGETEESILKSREYVYSLSLDDFNLAKFTPFPGSPIYQKIKEEGPKLGTFDEQWEQMDCMTFSFVPKGIKLERMETLFIDFYKYHFKRPKVLWAYITMIWKSPDSWRRFSLNILSFVRFAITNKRIN